MRRCIYSLVDFESSNKEHILQNFLGARWKSDGIVCNELQTEFGKTIDLSLEDGLRPIRNLLGTLGGRGGEGPILKGLPASSGEVVDLGPGGLPRLNRPIVREEQLGPRETKVSIRAGDVNQLNWAMSEIRQQYPDARFSNSNVTASAETVEGFVDGYVRMRFQVGGSNYFRGMLKACFNLLGVLYPKVIFEACFDAARDYVRAAIGSSERFVRWSASPDRLDLPQLGQNDQAIFMVSRGSSVEGIVQFFGEIIHPIRLTDSYEGIPIHCGYLVDPFRQAQPAEDRAPRFDEAKLPVFERQELSYSDTVSAAFGKRVGRIVERHFELSRVRMIEEIIEEVRREQSKEFATNEMVAEISKRVAQKFLRIPTHKKNRPSLK